MNTSVVRRLARIWPAAWRLAAAGWLAAIWWVLVLAAGASANDCLEYIKNLKNFVNIPKGLLEDCMRTGVVQAGTTAAVGSIGGGVIAVAVTKALKGKPPGPDTPDYREGKEGTPKENPFDPSDDERRQKWDKEKVVWDPQLLGWRPPRPDEYPPPDRPPEEAPPYQRQNPREKTPPECLALYDEYVKAQADLLSLEPELQRLAQEYQKVTDWLNLKKTLVTLQLGKDMTDLVFAGTGSVRLAKPVTKLVTALPDMLQAARTKLAAIAARRTHLLQDLVELGGQSARMGRMLGEMGEFAKNALKHVDELNELLGAASNQLKAAKEAVAVARRLDAARERRANAAGQLTEAEGRLSAAQSSWRRKIELKEWAERRHASFTAELARKRAALKAQIEQVEQQLADLRKRMDQAAIEAIEAIDKKHQALLEKWNALEKRVGTHGLGRYRQVDNRLKQLQPKVEMLRRAKAAKEKFLGAERAHEAAASALDRIDHEINTIKAEIQREVDRTTASFKPFVDQEAALEKRFYAARKAADDHAIRQRELAERRGVDYDEMQDPKYLELETAASQADGEWAPLRKAKHDAEAAAKRVETEMRNRYGERLHELDSDRVEATRRFEEAQRAYDEAAKELQPVSHPGVDLRELDEFEALSKEWETLQTEVKGFEEEIATLRPEVERIPQEKNRAIEAAKDQMGFRTERQRLETQKANLRKEMERSESWEEAAAREEPGNLEQWRSEVAGTNPASEAPDALRPLEERVRELREAQRTIDTEIGEMEQRVPPGASSQSLEADVARAEQELEARQREVQSAKTAAERAKAQETEAADNARRAERERAGKDAELEQVKKEETAAQEELNKLEHTATGEGLAGSGQHVRPPGDGGGDPALGEYQDLVKRSEELSKQYKPDWARGTEQLLKDGLQKIGKTWEQAFDGQSMEDMVNGIEKTKSRLAKIEQELQAKREEYDRIRGDGGAKLEALKTKLDQCIASHTFWQGPEAPQGGS